MGALRAKVLQWVEQAKKMPSLASDPGELGRLAKAALSSWDGGFAAQHAPIAPLTWQVSTTLLASSAASERCIMSLPMKAEIVGFLPLVTDLTTGAGAAATGIHEFQVSIDSNGSRLFTNNQGTTQPSASSSSRDGSFVNLKALDIQAPRLFGLRFDNTRTTELGFTFRATRGPSVIRNTYIELIAFVRPLEEEFPS